MQQTLASFQSLNLSSPIDRNGHRQEKPLPALPVPASSQNICWPVEPGSPTADLVLRRRDPPVYSRCVCFSSFYTSVYAKTRPVCFVCTCGTGEKRPKPSLPTVKNLPYTRSSNSTGLCSSKRPLLPLANRSSSIPSATTSSST